MANVTNLLAKLKVPQSATIQFTNDNAFPSNPEEGQLKFKDQILYIWSTINNISTWFPLTNVKDKYIHSQGGPATTWTVQHDLGTNNVIFLAYDDNDTVLMVNSTNRTNNSFELNFQESETGKCVVFASKELDTVLEIGTMFERVDGIGDDIIINGNLIPVTDDTWNLGSSTYKWNDMYLSEATLYVGDTVTVTGTGMEISPPASPTSLSEQPLYNASKLNLAAYNYNDGEAQLIKPSIVSTAKLEIGDGASPKNITLNTGKIIITASNFGITNDGTISYSGTIGLSSIDGGTWS
ncbi:MAG: hypothetical protein H8D97_01735 [Proteobacteria bacterium]|nr:hypothetical protein [Pseudomonadota bacterium]